MRKNRTQEGPEPIDIHLGALVRQHRVVQGLAQTDLAKLVDVTYQQIQKYETGENRINAPMLWKLAQVLKVPIGSFFRGLSSEDPQAAPALNRDALEVLRAYQAIPDRETRRSIKMMLRHVARLSADTSSADDTRAAREIPDQHADQSDTD